MREKILAPSILAADFKKLGEEIKTTEENGAKYLHFDVMDGMFVPSISFGAPVLQSIRSITNQVVDAHLMVTEPIRYVEVFAKAGADLITIHYEACENIKETIDKIKACNVKVGISIKPKTKAEDVLPFLNQVDLVLVMSVEPGFGGQSFMPESLERIKQIYDYIQSHNLDVDIQVDGGIYHNNVKEVLDAGVNIVVAGSAVFNGDVANNTKTFMEILKDHEK